MSIFIAIPKAGMGKVKGLMWQVTYNKHDAPATQRPRVATAKGVTAAQVMSALKLEGSKPITVTLYPCGYCNRIHNDVDTPCDMSLEAPGEAQRYGPVW